MNAIILIYIVNATLLLLHEIDSAYIKEWEILKLPGKITGFLLLHIPIIIILFWGIVEIEKQTALGSIIAVIAGIGGLMPYIVHKAVLKKEGYFDSAMSNVVIYLNLATGLALVAVKTFYR